MHIATSGNALEIFAALDPDAIAILLDVDGTIVDIEATPEAVQVSDDLRQSLDALFALTGGAVALVSGRLIGDLDRLFTPLTLPAIGVHGAEMRVRDAAIERGVAPLPAELRLRLMRAVPPGVLVEDKGYSLALHYRAAADQERRLREMVVEVCGSDLAGTAEILPGKAIIEVKRPQVQKGVAVAALMTRAPFSARMPVFIGDDVTDESVFRILPRLDGCGFSVGRQFPGLAGVFQSPGEVRRALRRLARLPEEAGS